MEYKSQHSPTDGSFRSTRRPAAKSNTGMNQPYQAVTAVTKPTRLQNVSALTGPIAGWQTSEAAQRHAVTNVYRPNKIRTAMLAMYPKTTTLNARLHCCGLHVGSNPGHPHSATVIVSCPKHHTNTTFCPRLCLCMFAQTKTDTHRVESFNSSVIPKIDREKLPVAEKNSLLVARAWILVRLQGTRQKTLQPAFYRSHVNPTPEQ